MKSLNVSERVIVVYHRFKAVMKEDHSPSLPWKLGKGLVVIGVEPYSRIHQCWCVRKPSLGDRRYYLYTLQIITNFISKIEIRCFEVFAKLVMCFFIRSILVQYLLMILYLYRSCKALNLSINITFRFIPEGAGWINSSMLIIIFKSCLG